MEPKFKNEYDRTRELVHEFYRYAYLLRRSRVVLAIVSFLVSIGCMWLCVIDAVSNDTASAATYLVLSLLLAACPFLAYLLYRMQAKRLLRRDAEISGGGYYHADYLLYDDRIVLASSSEKSIAYESVTRVILSPNLILLLTRARQCVILDKDGFTLGTQEACISFLKSKGLRF